MIDYDKFEKSLKHLEAQMKNYENINNREELTEIDREAIAESDVMQMFALKLLMIIRRKKLKKL